MEKIRRQKLPRLGKTTKFLHFRDKIFWGWWDLKSFAGINSHPFPVLTNFPNRNFCDLPVFKIFKFRRRRKEMFILPCYYYYYYFRFCYSFNNLEITAIISNRLSSIFLCISCFWRVSWLRLTSLFKIFLNSFHFSFQFSLWRMFRKW